jgi:hypothetical protein
VTARSRLLELAECFYDEWAGTSKLSRDKTRSEIEHIAGIADAILDEHASELAEKIRAESCGYGCEYTFANLIDPEVDK